MTSTVSTVSCPMSPWTPNTTSHFNLAMLWLATLWQVWVQVPVQPRQVLEVSHLHHPPPARHILPNILHPVDTNILQVTILQSRAVAPANPCQANRGQEDILQSNLTNPPHLLHKKEAQYHLGTDPVVNTTQAWTSLEADPRLVIMPGLILR